MAPRNPRLRPVPVRDEPEQSIEPGDPADVLDDLADVVDRVDGLRSTLPSTLRKAFDHVVVDLRHHADSVREFYVVAGTRS